MGFKDGIKIIDHLISFSKQRLGNDDAQPLPCYYNLDDANSPPLPADALHFSVVVVDLSIWAFNFGYKALTGADLLNNLQRMIDEDSRLFEAHTHIFCLDRREYVWNAKQIERERRVAAFSASESYAAAVTLAGVVAPPLRVPTESYEFALNQPMPADIRAVKGVPRLQAKYESFLVELLTKHIRRPQSQRRHVVIVSADVQHRTIFEPGEDATARTECDELTVGEGELQCIYFADRSFDRGVDSVMIRSGDTDSVALALMRVRHLLDADDDDQIRRLLWLDLTHAGNKRLLDVVQLWRNLMMAVRRIERAHGREVDDGVPHPIEWLVLLLNLGGNDYCERTSHVTPLLMFEHVEFLFKCIFEARGPPPLMFSGNGDDMVLDESVLAIFLLHCVRSLRSVVNLTDSRESRLYMGAETSVRAWFDYLAKRFSPAPNGATRFIVLPYEEMRAQIRRAAACLHMQHSAHRPDFCHTDAFAIGPDRLPLYGFVAGARSRSVTPATLAPFPFLRYYIPTPPPPPPQRQPRPAPPQPPPAPRPATAGKRELAPDEIEEIEDVDDVAQPLLKRASTGSTEDADDLLEQMERSLSNSSGYVRPPSDPRLYGSFLTPQCERV